WKPCCGCGSPRTDSWSAVGTKPSSPSKSLPPPASSGDVIDVPSSAVKDSGTSLPVGAWPAKETVNVWPASKPQKSTKKSQLTCGTLWCDGSLASSWILTVPLLPGGLWPSVLAPFVPAPELAP